MLTHDRVLARIPPRDFSASHRRPINRTHDRFVTPSSHVCSTYSAADILGGEDIFNIILW